ncbi:hypothetical protein DOY81_003087 [Sarcophaga bullata]|nr:hypothetical protein DOY81_003087 [Sarcophaga bullata]
MTYNENETKNRRTRRSNINHIGKEKRNERKRRELMEKHIVIEEV